MLGALINFIEPGLDGLFSLVLLDSLRLLLFCSRTLDVLVQLSLVLRKLRPVCSYLCLISLYTLLRKA